MSDPEAVPVLRKLGDRKFFDRPLQPYVPTGLRGLDQIIRGVVETEVTLIAGDPGQGKTTLAVQILEAAAMSGVKSALLSLEMSQQAILSRLIAAKSGLDLRLILEHRLTPQEKKIAVKAAAEIEDLDLYIDDRSGLSPDRVYRTLTQWKQEGVGVVAVDYLQSMKGEGDDVNLRVGDAVKAVKAAAMDAKLPLILLSSLNRSVNNRPEAMPRFSDLRGSGEIEFVADTIIMFYYPDAPEDIMADVRHGKFVVLKQRNGPTGTADFDFYRKRGRFVEPHSRLIEVDNAQGVSGRPHAGNPGLQLPRVRRGSFPGSGDRLDRDKPSRDGSKQ